MNLNKNKIVIGVVAVVVLVFVGLFSSNLGMFQGNLAGLRNSVPDEETIFACAELQDTIEGIIAEGLYVTPRLSAAESDLRETCENSGNGLLRINGPTSENIADFYERIQEDTPLLSFEEILETYELDAWELSLSCDAFFDGYDTFYSSAKADPALQVKFLETQVACKDHPGYEEKNVDRELTDKQCEVLNKAYDNQIESTTISRVLFKYKISIDQVINCRV